MAKRCLIVAYYFPPSGGGGVQRIVKMTKYLSRQDWKFTVITANENLKTLPSDQTLLNDIPPDLQIRRVDVDLAGDKRGLLRSFSSGGRSSYWKRWLSALRYIPDMRKAWLPDVRNIVHDELQKESYDCLFISSPPYSLALLAAQLQDEISIPVILDMRDPWTTNPYKLHPTKYHYWKDWRLERLAISKINYGISAYQTLLEYYLAHIPDFMPQRWRVIPNGYDEDDFIKIKPVLRQPGFFNVAFSGTFYSHINNPEYLFRAMALLKRNNPEIGGRLRFYHIGQSSIDLDKMVNRYSLTGQVIRLGYLPHQACLNVLAGMDALCFILDDRHKNSSQTIGGKVYEYLRLKKPILALVPPQGEAARLIHETQSGSVITPTDTAQIAQILSEWIRTLPSFSFMGIEEYSRERQAAAFLNVLESAAGRI